jgi:hypothetical protein
MKAMIRMMNLQAKDFSKATETSKSSTEQILPDILRRDAIPYNGIYSNINILMPQTNWSNLKNTILSKEV